MSSKGTRNRGRRGRSHVKWLGRGILVPDVTALAAGREILSYVPDAGSYIADIRFEPSAQGQAATDTKASDPATPDVAESLMRAYQQRSAVLIRRPDGSTIEVAFT